MNPTIFAESLGRLIRAFVSEPRYSLRLLLRIPALLRGLNTANRFQPQTAPETANPPSNANPLATYFNAHTHGKGIWKWLHYFEAYHQHFNKFVGKEVHVLEIGIYSGGSLEMWRDYFGPQLHMYGVDIEEACKAHENEYTKVFIGDQADRQFWREFKHQVPRVDILIDDGGHSPEQQMVTLEEMLPHLSAGGVYLCEDIQGRFNKFTSFVAGLFHNLNSWTPVASDDVRDQRGPGFPPTAFQSHVHSIHCYPFATVIEKRQPPIEPFRAPKQGSKWAPWL